jgi:hypothetical protein
MIGYGVSEVLAWHLAGKIVENHETHQDSSSLGRELNHGPLELKAGTTQLVLALCFGCCTAGYPLILSTA